MWLAHAYKTIQALVQAVQEPLPNEKQCEDYAKAAYVYCVSLYGQPSDPRRPYDLVKGVDESSMCSYALGRYTIRISPNCVTPEQQCMILGHEMYHRVTMHRKGLRRQVWVDELLAFLTSLWFLHQQGFSEYAGSFADDYTNSPATVNLKGLRGFRRPPWYVRLRDMRVEYPEDFYTGIARLGVALKRVVAGNDLCRIIKAVSIEEWIASLPEDIQYTVCRLLEVSGTDKRMPEEAGQLAQLFNALAIKGDKEATLAEFQTISRLQPANSAAFYYLGRAYKDLKNFDAALEAFFRAKDLNFAYNALPFHIASAYWYKGDFQFAAQWYQEAISHEPQWAAAYYYLGRSLNKMGDMSGARAAWEKTLTLSDEHFVELAQKALEENPLPNDMGEGSGLKAVGDVMAKVVYDEK